MACSKITVISNTPGLAVSSTGGNIVVGEDCESVVASVCNGAVSVSQGSVITINTGDVSAIVSPFTALEDIDAYDVVVAFGAGIRKATVTDITHATNVVGIALAPASTGGSVNVATHGRVTNPAWSWDDTLPLYLSDVPGLMVQDDNESMVNGAVFSLRLGSVRDPDTIDINILHDILYAVD